MIIALMSNQPIRDPLTRPEMTHTQSKVYAFCVSFFFSEDNLPSTRIIQKHFQWKSQTAAMATVRKLEAKQYLEKSINGKYRFVRPILDGRRVPIVFDPDGRPRPADAGQP